MPAGENLMCDIISGIMACYIGAASLNTLLVNVKNQWYLHVFVELEQNIRTMYMVATLIYIVVHVTGI